MSATIITNYKCDLALNLVSTSSAIVVVMKTKIRIYSYLWYALYAAGVLAIMIFWYRATGRTSTPDVSSVELAIGNITGLVGSYAVLWQLVLLSRLTFLENVFGLETITRLHKWNGYAALILLTLHAVFLTLGFAAGNHTGIWAQIIDFLTNWEDVLKATVALAMLIGIVFISIGIVRRGLKYETWFYIHLTTYIAIILGFSHQLSVGSDFVGNPAFKVFWYAIYALAAGAIIVYRAGRPTWLVYKHRFTVAKIVPETPDITSIYITGRQLEQFKYEPGQFIIWRFLTSKFWMQAHPFSISVAPNGKYLRLSFKAVGDFTHELSGIKVGSLVSVDGPHGNFTASRHSGPKLLLIAGGSGITPIRSMLGQMPDSVANVVLVYAARTRADLAFKAELDKLVSRAGGQVHYVLSNEEAPGFASGIIDEANLAKLVPDAAEREVMLCGPVPMMDGVTAALRQRGVPKKHIHTERFAY